MKINTHIYIYLFFLFQNVLFGQSFPNPPQDKSLQESERYAKEKATWIEANPEEYKKLLNPEKIVSAKPDPRVILQPEREIISLNDISNIGTYYKSAKVEILDIKGNIINQAELRNDFDKTDLYINDSFTKMLRVKELEVTQIDIEIQNNKIGLKDGDKRHYIDIIEKTAQKIIISIKEHEDDEYSYQITLIKK